jgi:hypothetical protein
VLEVEDRRGTSTVGIVDAVADESIVLVIVDHGQGPELPG